VFFLQRVIHILAGGPLEYVPKLDSYFSYENVCWVGVDRGVFYLLEMGIQPDIAFGDFDSVNQLEWTMIKEQLTEIKQFLPEKDETDMELALNWALKQKPDTIRIFGATGGRADHFLTNVMLITRKECLEFEGEIEMIDQSNKMTVLTKGVYSVVKSDDLKYVSFIPITRLVRNITLVGFKYPLYNKTVIRGTTLTISNELIQDIGTISFEEGILIMIRSRD